MTEKHRAETELQSRREIGTHAGSRHGRNSTLNRWSQSDRERWGKIGTEKGRRVNK